MEFIRKKKDQKCLEEGANKIYNHTYLKTLTLDMCPRRAANNEMQVGINIK